MTPRSRRAREWRTVANIDSGAWASDAAFLYVSAYSFEVSLRQPRGEDVDGRIFDRAELIERFRMLPANRFPNTIAYARELTSGDGHERFDFTLDLLLRGLSTATLSNFA